MTAAPLRPGPDVVVREIEGEAVLLDLDSGVYFGLNEVGTRIWRLLVDGCDPAVMAERLAADYDASPDVIARDITRVLDELRARGLIVPAPPDIP